MSRCRKITWTLNVNNLVHKPKHTLYFYYNLDFVLILTFCFFNLTCVWHHSGLALWPGQTSVICWCDKELCDFDRLCKSTPDNLRQHFTSQREHLSPRLLSQASSLASACFECYMWQGRLIRAKGGERRFRRDEMSVFSDINQVSQMRQWVVSCWGIKKCTVICSTHATQ